MGLGCSTLGAHRTPRMQQIIPILMSATVWLGTVPSSQIQVFFMRCNIFIFVNYIIGSFVLAIFSLHKFYILRIFSGVLDPEELLQTMNSRNTGNAFNFLGQEEEILLPSESLEPERTRKPNNYNFRKSLAWDNAFFTSAGMCCLVETHCTCTCYQHFLTA